MTGKQNNSIVEIKPNELVQHKNKFKSIAIYKEEQYESTVELVNENYKEQALTLSTSSDGSDANKLYVIAELAKTPKGVVSYEWKVLGVDGITNLIDEKDVNFSANNNELTITNQWDIKKFITIQAFAYSDGFYIASSDILTVYEKDANLISAITVDFSKDHVVIPEGIADSASIQTLTTTTVTVYRGEDNITSACKYIWSTKDGSVTNLVNSNQESAGGNVNGIKEFTNDTDELKVIIEVPKTTTLEGSITLQKIMPISRGGNIVYSIIPSTGVINITKMNMEQDYTFTMQQLTTAGGATTLTALPTGHSLAWQYINKNGIAIGNKTPVGSPTSGVWTFKYNPNSEGAAGFSIILSDSQGDIVDSEQITFIQDGVDYTGLILAASSQVFSTSDPSTATITLTAQLYGDLVGETVSWYLGDDATLDANSSNPYVIGIDELSGKTSLKVRAEAGNGEYSDTITIYKLNDAITAFFANELMTFSADALGMVGSQDKPVAFTSNVKVFQGITDVTNKITNISLTSINSLSNVDITPAYPTESDPDTVPSVTIAAKGTNFGTSEIISGKFSFMVTVDGIGNIPLDLSWIKIPAPNGINNIEEYYQATATNEAPNPYSDVDKKIIDPKWETTIIDAGQTKEKPYLWNFERIKKDNGDLLRDTDVSLLSSSPRTIVLTTEYYTTNTTGIIPAGATYNDADTAQTGNNAPKIDGTVWKTVEPTLAPGEYLYNFEVIQYAAVDADNKNLYTWTEPIQMGYAGEDGSNGEGIKYKYCLTNSATKPIYPVPANATYTWTDKPRGVSENNQYEYVISIITSPIVTVAKKIDTELREYDEEAWKRYGAAGHEENWTIRGTGPFDNSHIHLQDYAYVEGIITDSDPVQSVKLYGKVIGLTQSSTSGGNVRMRSEFLMIGDSITSDVALWAKWGNDGRGIIEVVEWYQATSFDKEDDNNKLVDSDWKNNISDTTFGEDDKYLWNYEVIKYSSAPLEESTDPAVIATYSKDGDNGRGIQSIENYYQLRSDENSPTITSSDTISTPPIEGSPAVNTWYNAPVQTTAINKYLWNCEKITYDDGSSPTFTAPARISTHGEKGNDGSGIAIFRSTYQSVTTTQLNNWSQAASDTWVMHQTPVDNQGNVLKVGDPFYAQVHCISDNKDYAILLHVRTAYSSGEKSIATKNAQGYFQIGDTGPQGAGILTEIEVYQLSEEITPPSIEVTEENINSWIEKNNLGIFPNDGRDYLWRCLKQTWNNGNITFTTPILLSDYEMGTLFAQIEGLTIARWCEKYERTLINGSTIATGTITAKQINTEGLSAEYIQSNDYALDFTLVEDHYKVGLKATGIPSKVVIPEKYNGKPVTELDVESFASGKNIIKKLAIPASITTHPFGLLKDYTEIEELHAPIHIESITDPVENRTYQPYFVQYFGSYDYGVNWVPENPPTKLQTVYLSGRPGVDTIFKSYFDTEYWSTLERGPLSSQITAYLTPSIAKISDASIQYFDCFNHFYYYQDSQYEGSETYISKTDEIYTYPVSTTGFCITSKEDRLMIDSPNFQVGQDGTVYAKAGIIGKVAIGDIVTGEQVTKITQDTISTTNILAENLQVKAAHIDGEITAEQINTTGLKTETIQSSNYEEDIAGFKITSVENKNMIDSPNFKVTQNGDITANSGEIAGWEITEDEIYKKDSNGNSLVGMYSSDKPCMTNNASPPRFYAGRKYNNVTKERVIITETIAYANAGWYDIYTLEIDGLISINSATVLNVRYVDAAANKSCSASVSMIEGNKIQYDFIGTHTGDILILLEYEFTVNWGDTTKFLVLEDGSLYANAASLKGTMTTGSTTLYEDNDRSYLSTTKNLRIESSSGAYLEFNPEVKTIVPEGDYRYSACKLYAKLKNGSEHEIEITFKMSGDPYYYQDIEFPDVTYGLATSVFSSSWDYTAKNPIKVKINKQTTEMTTIISLEEEFELTSDYIKENYNIIFSFKDVRNQSQNVYIATSLLYEGQEVEAKDSNGSTGWHFTELESIIYPSHIAVSGSFVPDFHNIFTLGDGNKKWANIYAETSSIGGSDKNIKNSIQSLSDVHDKIFDDLKPVSYKFNDNTSNRTHTGLIAQDVKEAVENAGLTTQDFAAYCEWENGDGSIGCGLRYGEFVSLCIDQIQKLKKRVEELEKKLL